MIVYPKENRQRNLSLSNQHLLQMTEMIDSQKMLDPSDFFVIQNICRLNEGEIHLSVQLSIPEILIKFILYL